MRSRAAISSTATTPVDGWRNRIIVSAAWGTPSPHNLTLGDRLRPRRSASLRVHAGRALTGRVRLDGTRPLWRS